MTAKRSHKVMMLACASTSSTDQTKLLCKSRINSSHRISLLQRVAIQTVSCAIGHLAADHRSASARRFRFKKLFCFGDCAFDLVIRRLENLYGHRGLIRNARPLAREAEVSREQCVASKFFHRGAALFVALVASRVVGG